jgi:hypothetical protein
MQGFGHRVYKNYDPRAREMKKCCYEVLQALHLENEPQLKLAIELERAALADPYFQQYCAAHGHAPVQSPTAFCFPNSLTCGLIMCSALMQGPSPRIDSPFFYAMTMSFLTFMMCLDGSSFQTWTFILASCSVPSDFRCM